MQRFLTEKFFQLKKQNYRCQLIPLSKSTKHENWDQTQQTQSVRDLPTSVATVVVGDLIS